MLLAAVVLNFVTAALLALLGGEIPAWACPCGLPRRDFEIRLCRDHGSSYRRFSGFKRGGWCWILCASRGDCLGDVFRRVGRCLLGEMCGFGCRVDERYSCDVGCTTFGKTHAGDNALAAWDCFADHGWCGLCFVGFVRNANAS